MKEEEEEEEEQNLNVKIIDGVPCLELPPGTLINKKIDQNNSVNNPFTFGWLQETKERQFMPDVLKEIQRIFNFPIVPGKWKVYKIEKGEIKETEEDEENDNSE